MKLYQNIAQAQKALAAKDVEIERLRLWIRRIDNINDDPARSSKEIDQACVDALAGKSMVGLINANGR
jgi:Fe-S-cluster formation regulator IscX/YfhJ